MSPPGRRRGDTGVIREHPCLHRDKPCGSTAYVYVIKCKIKMKSHSCCTLNESGFIQMIRMGKSIRHKLVKLSAVLMCSFTKLMNIPGRVAQSVTCLATDACLTADPGVASSIPARSHTFVEIDHEIISTVILLPSADSFKKGCCQLQAKVCAQITGSSLPRKKCG